MEENITIDQPFITDPSVIAEFVKMGIDPQGKTSTQLNDEIKTAKAKENAKLVFDVRDPLDYLSAGLTASGVAAGAGLGLKGIRTARKGVKVKENITKLNKLKNLLNPVYRRGPTGSQTTLMAPGSVGPLQTQLLYPKIPFGLKTPQSLIYGGGTIKAIDEISEEQQLADQAALLQDDINALRVEEVTIANQQLQEAQDNLDKFKTKEVDEDGEPSPPPPPAKEDVKPKVSNVFGTPQFGDFLRNVGASLVETGQMGAGLAQGAARAAEERAAKELAIEIETIKAVGKGAINPELKYKMNKDYIQASTEIAENAGSLDFLNHIGQMLQINDDSGIQSYGRQIGYKFKSIFSANAKMDPKTIVEDLLREISIGNAEEVLGQSSGRLSDKDIELARQLVSEIEGIGGIIGSTDKVLSILARRRADIERSQAKSGTTLRELEMDYYRYGVRPPDTGLFDILETLNTQAGGQTQEQQQEKTRIPLNPKDEALTEAGVN